MADTTLSRQTPASNPARADAGASTGTEWARAVDKWNVAHAAVERCAALPGGVPDEVMNAATDLQAEAVEELVALPAHDRTAVGIKINALLDYLDGCKTDVPKLRMIAADALRKEA